MSKKATNTITMAIGEEDKIINFDFADDLADGSETITSVDSVTVTPSSGLVVDDLGATGTKASCRADATAAGIYTLVCTIVSSLNQKLKGAGDVNVSPAG